MSTTQISTHDQAREQHTAGFGIYMAFIPWVLFAFIAHHSTLKLASVAAVGVSAAIALPSLLKGRPKLLELGAILAFAGFTLVAFNTDPATSEWVARYARAIAATLLSLIAFGSLRFVPFARRLHEFEHRYNQIAEPFGWKFTRDDLATWLQRLA